MNLPETSQNAPLPAGGWCAAALGIASGQSVAAAARAAGVHQKTVARWMRRPHFKALVDGIRSEMIQATLGKLLAVNGQAVDTMLSLLESKQDQVRMSAASKLVDLSLRVRQAVEVDRRLGEIENDFAEWRRLKKNAKPQENS